MRASRRTAAVPLLKGKFRQRLHTQTRTAPLVFKPKVLNKNKTSKLPNCKAEQIPRDSEDSAGLAESRANEPQEQLDEHSSVNRLLESE